MKTHRILGLDPGFANIGYTVAEIGKYSLKPVAAGVFQTEKSSKKRKVLAADDNLRRATEISEFMSMLIEEHRIQAICAESMSFPRSSSVAAKMAMCWGVICALAALRGIPIVQASPQEIKVAVTGKKTASKEEVQEAVSKKLSLASFLDGTARSFHEHVYDSGAAILTATATSDVIRILKAMCVE